MLDLDSGTCYELNKVAAIIAAETFGGSSTEHIVDQLKSRFGVDEITLADHVELFMKRLLEMGLVELVV